MSMKNPNAQSGMEPANFRLVIFNSVLLSCRAHTESSTTIIVNSALETFVKDFDVCVVL
jgi:hypothetical protein